MVFHAAILAGAMSLFASQTATPTPEPVMAMNIAAHVAAALGCASPQRVYTLSGSLDEAGLHGTERVTVDLVHRAYREVDLIGPASESIGYTGAVAWSGDSKGVIRVERFPSQSQAIASYAAIWTNALFCGHAQQRALRYEGERHESQKSYAVLSVSAPTLDRIVYWVDKATYLPVKIEQSGQDPVALSDYRSVDGIVIPFVQKIGINEDAATFTVRDVQFVPPAQPVTEVPGPPPADFSMAGSKSVVPMQLIENHVYVTVRVNGIPMMMIFDTGGSNVITPQALRRIRATTRGHASVSGVGASLQTASYTRVRTLALGAAIFRQQDFSVLDIRSSFGASMGRPIDGIIGYEVLSRVMTTFDYAHSRIVLRRYGTRMNGERIVFAFNGNHPVIQAILDGLPKAWFTVDTGSRNALSLTGPYWKHNKRLKPSPCASRGVIGFGVGGATDGLIGRTLQLRVGSFRLSNVYTAFSVAKRGSWTSTALAGNLGGAIWRRFTITFDYPRQQLILTPNSELGAAWRHDASGLFLIAKDGKIVVLDVLTRTPAAAAGIHPGDQVIRVGARVPSDLTDAREMLSSASQTIRPMSILVVRSGRPLHFSVRLSDYSAPRSCF